MPKKKINPRIKKVMKHPSKLGAGAKKRGALRGQEKVAAVMREFYRGTLHSSSGAIVTSPAQAKAIAMSEAGLSKPPGKRKTKRRKA